MIKTKKPQVSIIIVNWNGLAYLKDCFESLSKITYPNYEVVFVDNASSDDSVNFVKNNYPQTIILNNNNNFGFAEGNNIGVRTAKGKYIYLLNNDTKVDKGFLEPLVETLELKPDIGAIQSKIYIWGTDSPRTRTPHESKLHAGQASTVRGKLDGVGSYLTKFGFLLHEGYNQKDTYHKTQTIFSAKGAGFITRKSIINKIGLFDPNFFAYFEDTDFCWKVWLSGSKIIFEPKSVIHHRGGQTAKKISGKLNIYISFRNRIISLLTNLSTTKLLPIILLHYISCFGIALWFIIKGRIRYTFWLLLALIWPLGHILYIIYRRAKTNSLRKKTDQEIFKDIYHQVFLKTMLKYLT